MDRLYVVVRSDLEPGALVAQAVHAGSAFAVQHAALHASWAALEQNLVVLAIPSERALSELVARAIKEGIRFAAFHEPDMDDQLTACAFSGDVARLVSSLPLALRPPRAA